MAGKIQHMIFFYSKTPIQTKKLIDTQTQIGTQENRITTCCLLICGSISKDREKNWLDKEHDLFMYEQTGKSLTFGGSP
jgi:hypothetical protein